MIRFFIIIVAITGLWWYFIGNKVNQEPESPVQWHQLVDEARTLGSRTNANQCLNESLLKSRLCAPEDKICINEISIYVSACLETAEDFTRWCAMLPHPADSAHPAWANTACTLMGLESPACLGVAAHILAVCTTNTDLSSE